MNRGSDDRDSGAAGERGPSMRPRFMNRGSVADPRGPVPCTRPSMRPRFMNRGSSQGRPPDGLVAGPFNEAPIHESGKCRHLQVLG